MFSGHLCSNTIFVLHEYLSKTLFYNLHNQTILLIVCTIRFTQCDIHSHEHVGREKREIQRNFLGIILTSTKKVGTVKTPINRSTLKIKQAYIYLSNLRVSKFLIIQWIHFSCSFLSTFLNIFIFRYIICYVCIVQQIQKCMMLLLSDFCMEGVRLYLQL